MPPGLTITVNKTDLLKALIANRDAHEKEYRKAKTGWKKLLGRELQNMLDILNTGGELDLIIRSQKPDCHLPEYEEAIEMVEANATPTLELDAQLYRQFMRNDWNWRRQWMATNTTYIENA